MKFATSLELNEDAIARVRERLRGAVGKVAAHRLTVGIHETDGGDGKRDYAEKEGQRTLAAVAMDHEYGTDVLPERSWLRSWFDANTDRLRQEMTAAMRGEYQGKEDAVRALGEKWREELRDFIGKGEGSLTPITLDTYKRKEAAGLSSPETPLYATGQLVEAIAAMLDGAPA